MTDPPLDNFIVVGAGLSGSLMACYLAREGYSVDVFERRPDPRTAAGQEGRSINLAISTRAIHALREVGLADRVLETAVPMRGRMMHAPDGKLTFQPYGTESHQVINSVSRGGLNITLLDALDALPNVRVHFSLRASAVDLVRGAVTFTHVDTTERVEARGIVIGADGVFSRVRRRMQRLDRFNYGQSYLEYGYKELTIPPKGGGGFQLEPNALHIWPRGRQMMIALPNQDGSFTCTLFWPFSGPHGLESLVTPDQTETYFRTELPDAALLMPTLGKDYLANPNSSLVTIRCGPWYVDDKVVLIGDACHAVVPFYGQGANAAFEDCTVLAECLREHAPNWEAAFSMYYRRRKADADVLADLAVANFVEMRDRVNSRLFLLRKQAGKMLHRIAPRVFVPLYTMVTFTRMPYAEAVQRARRQSIGAGLLLAVVLLILGFAVVRWLWN